jgi:hypothetical protein
MARAMELNNDIEAGLKHELSSISVQDQLVLHILRQEQNRFIREKQRREQEDGSIHNRPAPFPVRNNPI